MDPNATYAAMLELVRSAMSGEEIDATHLAEIVDSLDAWLRAGGFLPEAWAR